MKDLYTQMMEDLETPASGLPFDGGASRTHLALRAAIAAGASDLDEHMDRFSRACEVALERVLEAA